jgi:hypothetical protein
MTNWQKIAKSTYEAFNGDDKITITKNCNTWNWEVRINGIFKKSYGTLEVAKACCLW